MTSSVVIRSDVEGSSFSCTVSGTVQLYEHTVIKLAVLSVMN